jgi:hypothetical protein
MRPALMAKTLPLVIRMANDARFVTATTVTHGFGERDQESFNLFFCLTLNTGADVTRRLLFTEFDYLREANGNDDARVFEHAARDTATATSSKSVLGNVEARGRAHDYTETDSRL